MAAANTATALPTAFDRAVFFDRLDAIRAAGWLVTTVAAQHWADADLVHPDHEDDQVTGKPHQPFAKIENRFHQPLVLFNLRSTR